MTAKKRPRNAADRQDRAAPILIATALGLTGGVLEVAVHTARKVTASPIMELPPDYVWMIPLVQVTLVLLPVAGLVLASQFWPSLPLTRSAVFVGASAALFNLLIFVPGIHHAALLLLALGAGAQLARWAHTRQETLARVAKRVAIGGTALVTILALGVRGWSAWKEGQARDGLPRAEGDAPNVLLITLDTVRRASMSLYGYGRRTTPNLEEFAARGVVFERAISTASWTLPAHGSLFTGRWPHEMDADYRVPLSDRHTTLAGYLASRGYLTAGFVANMKYCGYETGLDRGFVHYDDYGVSLGRMLVSSNSTAAVVENFRIRKLIRNDQPVVRKTATEVNEEFLAWLDRSERRPFFAFLNYFDAHEPYLPPAPFDTLFGPGRAHGKYSPLHHWLYEPERRYQSLLLTPEEVREEKSAYDGSIAYVDSELGRLFEELRRRNILRNTLVVVTSDHGEEFGRHRVFEHGYSLYLPSVHVPLLFRFPERLPEGARIQEHVSLRDVPATVLDVLGIDGPSPFPGRTLSRFWGRQSDAESAATRSVILSELSYASGQPAWFPVSKGDMKSLIDGRMRYIRNGDGSEELYDVVDDPWEQRDLADQAPYGEVLAGLRGRLDSILGRESDPLSP